MAEDDRTLVIVSNRGPAEFDRNEVGERVARRGGGGLVTALSGLVAHRGALWVASATAAGGATASSVDNSGARNRW